MTSIKPSRGDIWLVDLNPTKGHEQAGKRPCLVVYVDLFNQGASGLAVVLPITSKDKGIPFHIEVNPPEGGLTQKSFIKCEDVRSISVERFSQKWVLEANQNLDPEDRELIMELSPLYLERLDAALQSGVQQGIQQGIETGIQQGERLVVENMLRVRFGALDEELRSIIEPLLELPPEEFTRLVLQLSRDELLARFRS